MGDSSKEAQGKRLKRAREARYGTAREAAAALGLAEQTYMPYESGRTGFRHRAARFAQFLGVSLVWLLTGDGPMRPGGTHPVLELFERVPPEKQPQILEMMELYANRNRG